MRPLNIKTKMGIKMTNSVDTTVKEKINIDSIFDEFKKWKVIFYNDNTTTVDFVIVVLREIFDYDENSAIEMTQKIHNNGKEVVGLYIYEVAEQKASETLYLASQYGFPLKVKVVKDE